VSDRDAPIGIFDSGVGGFTVVRAVVERLPHESIVYVGDTANGPYGPKPIADIRRYALDIMDHLVSQGVKLLVIACNSASAAVLRDARERYQVPVVEVIQPAVRRAVTVTRNGKVGVIGTTATIASRAYDDAFAAAPYLRLTTQACPDFVPFVERGVTSGPELEAVAREYLASLERAQVDTLVLGCTHYPLLSAVIGSVMGSGVTLVSSAEETAASIQRELLAGDLTRVSPAPEPQHRCLATGTVGSLALSAARFLAAPGHRAGKADEFLSSWTVGSVYDLINRAPSAVGPESGPPARGWKGGE
jgi:glutamate racemase